MILWPYVRASEGGSFVDAHFSRQLSVVQSTRIAKSSSTVGSSPPLWSFRSVAAVTASGRCRFLLNYQSPSPGGQ